MNIVFWLIVALAVIIIWFLLRYSFEDIGNAFLKGFNSVKQEVKNDSNIKNNNQKGNDIK